ncbi:MAG: glycosyltransferase [Planctomycetaceae bacterium]
MTTHYLLTTFGSSGDVYPMLGLAKELQRRGHRVSLATNAHFESACQANDVEFHALGTSEEFEASIRNPDLWKPNKAFVHVFRCLMPVVRRQYELIRSLREQGPLVTISNCLALGARMAHEKLNIPNVTIHLQPAVLWSRFDPPTLPNVFGPKWLRNLLYKLGCRFVVNPVSLPFVNEWRAELELPPIRSLPEWWHSPSLVVCLFPEWFAPKQPDWPANLVQTDFPLWNDQSGKGLAPELARFVTAGPPPVVFAAGTGNIHGASFFRAAAGACEQAGLRGILLTKFAEQLPQNLSANILYVPYVPLDDLLPSCAALVHHGGIGTMSQALAAGIPQLIMPLAHDQFDNAARVRTLGCGDSLVPARFTAPRVASMLQRLLNTPNVLQAATVMKSHMRKHDGLSAAVDAIERLR